MNVAGVTTGAPGAGGRNDGGGGGGAGMGDGGAGNTGNRAGNRSGNEGGDGFVAPSNQVEESIAELWREALGIERVSVDASFLELGGHSLVAAPMQAAPAPYVAPERATKRDRN